MQFAFELSLASAAGKKFSAMKPKRNFFPENISGTAKIFSETYVIRSAKLSSLLSNMLNKLTNLSDDRSLKCDNARGMPLELLLSDFCNHC